MKDILIGMQSSITMIICLCLLLFISYPKQVKKWETNPPEPFEFKPKRMLLSALCILMVASFFGIGFSINARYAAINFVIICLSNCLYLTFVISRLIRYSKPRSWSTPKYAIKRLLDPVKFKHWQCYHRIHCNKIFDARRYIELLTLQWN